MWLKCVAALLNAQLLRCVSLGAYPPRTDALKNVEVFVKAVFI